VEVENMEEVEETLQPISPLSQNEQVNTPSDHSTNPSILPTVPNTRKNRYTRCCQYKTGHICTLEPHAIPDCPQTTQGKLQNNHNKTDSQKKF
jgi:hypothetical protein